MSVRIIQGDARSTGLDDRSVHCIATSPPYWGLRAYLKKDDPNAHLEIGKEPTPEAYVESLRAVGRECYRVLRADGVMWLNLGDTYASGEIGRHDQSTHYPGMNEARGGKREHGKGRSGLPSGNLVGIPWRVAFALQSDGWILRAAIPWIKANGMPESVKNRPTVAHEYVFLFAKRAGYFYDADAVRMPNGEWAAQALKGDWTRRSRQACPDRNDGEREQEGAKYADRVNPAGRNLRTSDFMHTALDEYEAHIKRARADGGLLLSPEGDPLMFLVNPVANSLGHFAMWAPKLVAPMILAGTSARGCCPACGAQWRRKVEKGDMVASGPNMLAHKPRSGTGSDHLRKQDAQPDGWGDLPRRERTDLGFFPACSCPAHEPIPSTVFDPFGGTGTTAQVAEALGRSSVICELNPEYHPLIRQRLAERLNPRDWRPVPPQAPPEQGGFGW